MVCDPHHIDHYVFDLRSEWDVVRLWAPFNKPPQFQTSWGVQDATNLLNLIEFEAIGEFKQERA